MIIRECYCGATLGTGSVVQSATDCNMLCTGNSTEYCGAGNRLNLYQKLNSSSTPTPTPTPSPSPTPSPNSTVISSPTIISSTPTPSGPSFTGYDYVGCLTDDVANRALVGKSRGTSDNTYAACASFCSGYQHFGVEYSSGAYSSSIAIEISN